MDFPIELAPNFIYGRDELRQNVVARLKNPAGSFIQSSSVGALFSVHTTDTESIQSGVLHTMEQIPYIKVEGVQVNLPDIEVSFTYNGKIINFQYTI